ncbi:MAG: hypothetical protein ACFFAY_06115 [Promethearchaeota archaeon]
MHVLAIKEVVNNEAEAIKVRRLIYKTSARKHSPEADVNLCVNDCNMDCSAVTTCANIWRLRFA